MGSNTLNARSAGQTILDTFFNDFNTALGGDFIGRNSSGVPSSGQNLGTTSVPWGAINAQSLILNGTAVDASKIVSPVNRIISGAKRSSSNQPAFITPNGAAPSFIVTGSIVSLVYDVNGTAYTISTDITKGSLTPAPSSSNTCVINDAAATGQSDTRLWGEPEHRKVLTVSSMGSNISGKVGKFCAFKIGTEYFIGLVDSSTQISHCRRGYFYDSSINPVNRSTFSNGATITLMNLGWVFADIDQATIDVSFNPPVWSNVAPSSPATGDYWYDFSNKEWKRYDGATFQIINRVLIGNVVLDSANCVAARCIDFYAAYSSDNTISLDVSTTEIAIMSKPNSKVNVAGNIYDFAEFLQGWNITTDLAGTHDMYSATEQASTVYYFYLKDDGRAVISDISPYFRNDLLGRYHPHNPWRCVGIAYNDGSSNITKASGFVNPGQNRVNVDTPTGYGSVGTSARIYSNVVEDLGAAMIHTENTSNGNSTLITDPGEYECVTTDNGSAAVTHVLGISRNPNDLTLAADGQGPGAQIVCNTFGPNTTAQSAGRTVELYIGDIIVCLSGTMNNNSTSSYLKIIKKTSILP